MSFEKGNRCGTEAPGQVRWFFLRCYRNPVYRVAERFLTGGLAGLADRREDNGQPKIPPAYQAELLRLVEESPRQFGYRRPSWTQELLARVLAERVEVAISAASMSRLLGR